MNISLSVIFEEHISMKHFYFLFLFLFTLPVVGMEQDNQRNVFAGIDINDPHACSKIEDLTLYSKIVQHHAQKKDKAMLISLIGYENEEKRRSRHELAIFIRLHRAAGSPDKLYQTTQKWKKHLIEADKREDFIYNALMITHLLTNQNAPKKQTISKKANQYNLSEEYDDLELNITAYTATKEQYTKILEESIFGKFFNLCKITIALGADINAHAFLSPTQNDIPLLCIALTRKANDIVTFLLSLKDINVNPTEKPLCWAITFHNDTEIIKQLMNHPQIDINAKDPKGSTALKLACLLKNKDYINLLFSHPHIDVSLHGISFRSNKLIDPSIMSLLTECATENIIPFEKLFPQSII